jgi:3-dehydroquinate synthase
MKNTKLTVATKSKSYPIYFGNNIINSLGLYIKKDLPNVKKICLIIDVNLPKSISTKVIKSLSKFKVKIIKVKSNEKNKRLKTAISIIEELLKNNFNRADCVVSCGGGIVGDLSAFVANLTKRGLKFVNIPTTLLAQVDASVGGKTGVNTSQGKNLIGTYYQPDFILSDVSVLKKLPKREMVAGYGEILKHSLIINKRFFLWLLKNGEKVVRNKDSGILKKAIFESCKIKSTIVNKDEKEKNLRMILNFGHTFAHGFEATHNFTKKLNHGEAVLLGMMIASEFSFKKKLLSFRDLLIIKDHYYKLQLPTKISKFFKKEKVHKIVEFMKKDKKNINEKINLILLKKIGKTTEPLKVNINSDEIKKFLYSYY